MNYIVSALKYRPKKFNEVVGQQAVTSTLQNAVAKDKLAKALLFTGPRGVGKTTCARILAREINKHDGLSEDEDFAFNIFELDAASNNSVEDIRSLIEQVRIPPQTGKYKVYIIDEVHMLSQSAFNAFLKTLEEPPEHAVFILATTEKHKIIPTILSRCQIYDFKRISAIDIKNHLMDIANKENLEAEEDALFLIAQKADGALRDALSMFDKVVSYSDGKITRQLVSESMSILDYDAYFDVVDLMLQNDIPGILNYFNQLMNKGFDAHQFIAGLGSHLRDLLVSKDAKTLSLLEVSDTIKKRYLEQSKNISFDLLMPAIDLTSQADIQYKLSKSPQILVELTLMKLASLQTGTEAKKKVVKIIPADHFRKTPQIIEDKSVKKQIEQKTEEIQVKKTEQKPKVEELKRKPLSKHKVGLSINNFIKKKEAFEQESKLQKGIKLPEDAFEFDDFYKYWSEYLDYLRKNHKKNLLSILNSDKPKIEGNKIKIKLSSTALKNELLQSKEGLLDFIRTKLNNYKIDFDIEIDQKKKEEFVYYSKDKFKKLIEKNPKVLELKNKLGLELK